MQCDGQRPSCSTCPRLEVNCNYENVAANETRASAAKRQGLSNREQLDDIAASLALLKSMPNEEASRWFSALRSTEDPLTMLQSVRNTAHTIPPRLSPALSSSSMIQFALSPEHSSLNFNLGMEHPILYPLFPLDDIPTNSAGALSVPLDETSTEQHRYE